MASTSVLRLRRVLVEHGSLIAALLLVLGATALGGAWWIYDDPETTQVTDYRNEQTIRTAMETRATATGATGLYRRGQQLENMPVYLQRAAPELALVLRTNAASDAEIRVEQRLVLVTRAVHDGAVFWSENRTLARDQATDETVVSRATLNVSDLRERLAERKRAIGDAGELRMHLRFRVRYDTGRYSGTFARRLPVDLGSGWYAVPTTSLTRTRRTEVTRTVTVPRNRLQYLAPGALGALAMLCGIAVGGLSRTRWTRTDEELTRQLQHETHAEWISEGSLSEVDADRRIAVASVEDLVDVAIDTDRRVIHDPARDLYAVVDDAAVYYHRPAGDWEWQGDPFGHEP